MIPWEQTDDQKFARLRALARSFLAKRPEGTADLDELLAEFALEENEQHKVRSRAQLEDAARRHRKNVEAEVRWLRLLVERQREQIKDSRDLVQTMKGHGDLIKALRADVDRLQAARRTWLQRVMKR